ncbi:MAG: hypothetical protein PHE89_00110 [Alphaproteobacteria bacterium]|nr:hypothetical protein [Alphaproteobacteria bacterium]
MEKNEIALSQAELDSLNSLSWNFILFLGFLFSGVVLFLWGFVSFFYWLGRKSYQKILKARFRNYVLIQKIDKEHNIVISKSGFYGISRGMRLIKKPVFQKITLRADYVLVFQEHGEKAFVPFQMLKKNPKI